MRYVLLFDHLESKLSLSQVVSIPPVTVGPAAIGPSLGIPPGALIGPITPSNNDPSMPITQNPGDLPGDTTGGTAISGSVPPAPSTPAEGGTPLMPVVSPFLLPVDTSGPTGDFPTSGTITPTVC